MRPPVPEDVFQTYKTLFIGLIVAFCMLAPSLSIYLNLYWPWARHFPITWLGLALSFMIIFFHELGHMIAGWFYGYVALPSFDLMHGGGMTYYITGQLLPLNILLDGAIIYYIYRLREFKLWQAVCILIGLFHIATAYSDFHQNILSIAGPLAETSIGGFMLTRAWLNRAARGTAERLCNAAFGFGILLNATVSGWSMIHDADVRQVYFEQKGGHGFGDFDQVADLTGLSFNHVIWLYLGSGLIAIITPLILYALRDRLYLARYED